MNFKDIFQKAFNNIVERWGWMALSLQNKESPLDTLPSWRFGIECDYFFTDLNNSPITKNSELALRKALILNIFILYCQKPIWVARFINKNSMLLMRLSQHA